MRGEIEDFGTGWFGVKLGLDLEEIDSLIEFLQILKRDPENHFHIFSTAFDTESGGIADIEFSRKRKNENANLQIGG